MSRTFKAAALAVLLLPAAARGAARPPGAIRVRVDAGYPASLYYAVDNMAGGSFRASAYYWEFWRKRYGLGEEDRALLDRYRRLREKYESRGEAPDAWPLLFAGSRTLDEVWPKSRAGMSAKDARALRAVFLRFDREFRPYWDEHGSYLGRAAADFDAAGMPRAVAGFLVRAADFLELPADFAGDDVLVLAWHPGLKASANLMHDRRLGRVMIVEVPEGLGYEDQIGAAVRELVRGLLAAVPAAVRRSLSERMLRGGRPGLFFLQGLDAGLATALGQGAFLAIHCPKRFDADGGWYAPGVDEYAKAIYPEVRRALDSGATLRASSGALAAAVRPLADKAKLAAFFKNPVLLTDGAGAELSESLFNALDVGRVDEYAPGASARRREEARAAIAADPARPVVVMIRPRSLSAPLAGLLGGALDGGRLAKARKLAARGPVAVVTRSTSGRLCLLLLGTREELEDGVAALRALEYPAADAAYSLRDGRPVPF